MIIVLGFFLFAVLPVGFILYCIIMKYKLYYLFLVAGGLIIWFFYREIRNYRKQQEEFRIRQEAQDLEIKRQVYENLINPNPFIIGNYSYKDEKGNTKKGNITISFDNDRLL